MPNYVYTDPTGRKLTKTAYDAQVKAGQIKPPTLPGEKSQTDATNPKSDVTKPDIFGDTSFKPTVAQTKTGFTASTGENYTDWDKIDTSKVNLAEHKYGSTAEQQESATPGYISQRNDVLGAYFLKSGKTDFQSIYDELSKEQSFASADEEKKTNTATAIAKRIGEFAQNKKKSPIDEERDALTNEYETKKNQLLKAGAIEDRYTNFNEVNDEVNKVLIAGGNDKATKGYAGTPTDKDIQDIATKTGVTFDRAKRIMQGFGYESLQMQPEYEKETMTGYNRGITDLETDKTRKLADLDRQMQETKQKIQRQQQDVLEKAKRNVNALEVIGGIRGYATNSGFVDGVNKVHEDAQNTISRLETMLTNAENATEEDKARLLEDYNTNLSRAKEDLDYQLRDIKTEMGNKYSTVVEQYSGETLYNKLKELNSELAGAKIGVINDYVSTLSNINKLKYDQIDYMIKVDSQLKSSQKDTWSALSQDSGAALQNFSVGDLQEMYKSGSLSMEQYKIAVSTMVTKAQNTLYAQGTPTQDDIDNLSANIDSGLTVSEAIQKTILESNGRLEPISTYKGSSTSSGTKKAGAAGDRAIRHNNPVAMTTDVAKTLGLKEGVDYVRGDPFTGSGGNTMYTARLTGDAMSTMIKAFDTTASNPKRNIFYTDSGGQRWTHTAMSDKQRLSLDQSQKEEVIKSMFDRESPYSWDQFEENAGKGATSEITSNIINDAATKSDIDKYIKDKGISKPQFVEQFFKEASPTFDEAVIGDAMTAITDSAASSKEDKTKFISNYVIPGLAKAYGSDVAAEFLAKRYKDLGVDQIAKVLAIIYKGKKVNEDNFKSLLERAGIGWLNRRRIYGALEDLI